MCGLIQTCCFYLLIGVSGTVAQVVISCMTPRYVVSHHCNKEMALADLLHKPIIPVIYDEQMPWPPAGAMSLIFARLVYINLRCQFTAFVFCLVWCTLIVILSSR